MRALFSLKNPNRNKGTTLLVLTGILAGFAAVPAFAAVSGDNGMDWWDMGLKLFGGLALFLFGMEQMADALKSLAAKLWMIENAEYTVDVMYYIFKRDTVGYAVLGALCNAVKRGVDVRIMDE